MPRLPILRDKPDDRADAPELDQRTGRPDPAPPAAASRPSPSDKGAPPPQPRRSRTPLIVLGIAIVIGAIGGGYYWWTTRNLESTDDAYTDGHAITVAPQVAGIAVKLAVTDNEFVHAGQLLVQIDPRDYVAARDQAAATLGVAQAQLANAQEAYSKAQVDYPAQLDAAQANLDSAEATLTNTQQEYHRQHSLIPAATTKQNVDNADWKLRQAEATVLQMKAELERAQLVKQNIAQAAAAVKQSQAQVEQAQAALDHAELNLSYTHVLARQDGWITQRRVEQGDYLQVGSALLAVVSPQVWVTANFKETQLGRMRPGQTATVTVDAFPKLRLTGHVDSIQMGSGSKFTAFPPENATGNFVKIVQRVPVKILIDSGLDGVHLPLAISVIATVRVE